uniref:Major facilitator superfamily (MFS) profile domain-containing protein n=1 Tax=Bracon brevicornis TaxID=1563983 RepID=A0A6V7HQB5_9HYME
MMYIMTILDIAKISVDLHLASVICACAHIAGGWLSTLTTERFGRRPLLFLSTSGMAICHSVLGIFFLAQYLGIDVAKYGWLTIVAITVYGFSYSTGLGPLCVVISNELYNPELASICNSISQILFSILAFTMTKFFPLVKNAIGLHNCFFIFFCVCVVGFFVTMFIIPETKGKTIESIRKELQNSKNEKVHQIGEQVEMELITTK